MSHDAEQNLNASQASGAVGTALPFVLCGGIVLIGVLFGIWKLHQVQQWEEVKSQAISAEWIGPPLVEFELTERSGNPFRSLDMKGRVWVASYFFTSCPGPCLRLNANIQVLSKTPELKDVTWVSITCDPDNDTLEVLRAYADRWQADPKRWLFCRADLKTIERVAKGMNLYLSLKGHQDYAIVFDKQGKMRGTFDATSESQCKGLKTLLLQCLEEEASKDAAAGDAEKEKSS